MFAPFGHFMSLKQIVHYIIEPVNVEHILYANIINYIPDYAVNFGCNV